MTHLCAARTQNPEPLNPDFKPQTPDPNPQTITPKPQTPDPNPKHQTPNLNTQTQQQTLAVNDLVDAKWPEEADDGHVHYYPGRITQVRHSAAVVLN